MNYNIIASSSKGNCVIVNDFFMLDVGVSYAKIKKYLKNIKLIFISHVHSDHLNIRTINQISYNFPNIKYVVGSTDLVEKLATIGKVSCPNIFALPSDKWFELGLLQVKLERVTHDVSNHLCKFKIGSKKGVYIVDTSNLDNVCAKDYTLYLIEANYNEKILKKHIEECEDENKMYYLDRVSKTHLSFEQANDFLISNMNMYSTFEFIHKSSYNYIGEIE